MTSYVGQSLKRFEDPRLLTGRGSFVDDITLPEMFHAYVLRSPHAHARIVSIDASAAQAAPGVVAVLSHEDIAGKVGGIPVIVPGEQWMVESHVPSHPPLAVERVFYVGQPVAIVAARERYQARDAASLLQVIYEPLTPIVDPLAAIAEDAPLLHPELSTNLGMKIAISGGDVDEAFGRADHVVEQRFEVQRLAPNPMETRGVVAHYQADDDSLTVWDSTQEPHQFRRWIAEILGRPADKVRVIAPDVGGGFGAKGSVLSEDLLVPYLSILLGHLVKWVEDRQENILAYQARGHTVDVEAAVQRDGSILGMRVRIVADLGAFFIMTTPVVPTLASHRIPGPYKTPAMTMELLGVLTNKPVSGAYRGAGGPESAFCMERTMDLIAREMELDPVEVRRVNLIAPDAFPHITPTGLSYDSGDYQRGLDRVLEMADYSGWRRQADQRRADEPLIGVGLATVLKGAGGAGIMAEERARITIEPSGRVTASTGLSPHGQGTETSFAQIVATELGVDPAGVRMVHSDTDLFPSGAGTAASRGTVVGASALYLVLQQSRTKLASLASHILGCSVDDISFRDGNVLGGETQRKLSFVELAAAAYNEEMLPADMTPGLDFDGSYSLPSNTYAYGPHVAVVEVDQDTGEIKLLRYVALNDCGPIINPMLVEGQLHGGIVQGIGQALTEGMVYGQDGQPATGSLMDYALPFAEEIPDMVLETMETHRRGRCRIPAGSCPPGES